MNITGNNLQLVRDALDLADKELHNKIFTCPDVFYYAADIDDIEADRLKLKRLLSRVDKAIAKENKDHE
ncbi:MAG: hypothetical protein PHQ40_16430 [Anaerolineaceae bacterium]|nr:hypothetical protein [Anaerolineaceae bacterium]